MPLPHLIGRAKHGLSARSGLVDGFVAAVLEDLVLNEEGVKVDEFLS